MCPPPPNKLAECTVTSESPNHSCSDESSVKKLKSDVKDSKSAIVDEKGITISINVNVNK